MPPNRRGRLVALLLPAGPAFVHALAGTWEAGDAVLPLDPALPRRALGEILAAMRPAELVDGDGRHRLGGALPVGETVGAVVTTSGSGGTPKGVELDHAALAASARATAARIGTAQGDRWLCCLPPHHIGGFQVVARALASGAGLAVHRRFDAGAVAASDATLVSLVPTMLHRLVAAGADLSRFRRILLGGAAPPPGLVERARASGARIVVTYGMTETCGGCVYDGTPLDGVEVATGDGGRIRIRGPVLLRGYRDRADLTAAALAGGWFVTSDLGRLDRHGRLEVLGRADRVIVSGGANVVAEQVEALLGEHPGVAEAAVCGRDDPEWGQRVVAVVVPRDPADPPSTASLRAHVADRAASYAAPSDIVVVRALPRLATGKVDHAAVRERYGRREP